MIPLWIGIALCAVAVLRLVWSRREVRRRATDRLDPQGAGDEDTGLDFDPERDIRTALMPASRPLWIGLAVAGVGAAALSSVWPLELAVAVGLLVGTLGTLVAASARKAERFRIESRLADAIDLAVAGLRAGTSLHAALRAAAEESRGILRQTLSLAAARLRLGEPPERVFSDLHRTLPTRSVRLLGQTLAAQWEAGGSVAPTLASVATSIRQRVELQRRVQSQAAEVRFSVFAVLGATYAIGFLSWTNAPENVEGFLQSSAGSGLLAAAIVLQCVGLLWIQKMSLVEVG